MSSDFVSLGKYLQEETQSEQQGIKTLPVLHQDFIHNLYLQDNIPLHHHPQQNYIMIIMQSFTLTQKKLSSILFWYIKIPPNIKLKILSKIPFNIWIKSEK